MLRFCVWRHFIACFQVENQVDTLANSSTHATTHKNYRKGFPVTDHDQDREQINEEQRNATHGKTEHRSTCGAASLNPCFTQRGHACINSEENK